VRTSKIVASIGIIIASLVLGCVGGFFLARMFGPNPTTKAQGQAINGGAEDVERRLYNILENDINPAYASGSGSNIVNTSTTPVVEERRFQKQGDNKFTININALNAGDIIDEYVTPEMHIVIKMESVDSYGPEWSISVNGSEPAYRETSIGMADELEFYYTNQYILYETCDGTDIRSSKLIAINNEGKLVKEIYEYDEDNKGLVLRDVECDYNALIVKASRFGHGETIYADKYYKASPMELSDEAYEKIPSNVVLSAIYVYKIGSDGSIDFNNPQVINTQTFKEYVEDYLYNSTDETDLTTKMHNFLERNK